MDLFPSILAAMGYEIEGNRLGLGTNLFSVLYGVDLRHPALIFLQLKPGEQRPAPCHKKGKDNAGAGDKPVFGRGDPGGEERF